MEEPQDHTWVWSLGGEDPPEKKTETHSSILSWEVQCTEECSGLQGMGSQKSWTQLSNWAHSGKITNGWHIQFSSVQFSRSVMANSLQPRHHNMPGLPVHHQFPESTQTHVYWVVMPSNHLILYRPLVHLPSIFPSISIFSNESALLIRWPN